MKAIDLSHQISQKMPVYPGTPAPKLEELYPYEEYGFREKLLSLTSHSGTHIDAPFHMLETGGSLDKMEPETFFGAGLVIDVSAIKTSAITVTHMKAYSEKLALAEFLLLNTGWNKYWGESRYFEDYPVLTREAASWLACFRLKGIGIDAVSFDPVDSKDYPVHRTFFEKGLVLVENLTNLDAVGEEGFYFSCLPISYADADGSPVRAAAIIL